MLDVKPSFVKFLIVLLVYFYEIDYELEVFDYDSDELGIEVSCPEGHEDECSTNNLNRTFSESVQRLFDNYNPKNNNSNW